MIVSAVKTAETLHQAVEREFNLNKGEWNNCKPQGKTREVFWGAIRQFPD